MPSISIIIAALTLGFLGSFHCIGMCGPIALSLPVAQIESKFKRLIGLLAYNVGRVVTYGIIGLIFGFIGMQVDLLGWGQLLSVILGVLLILMFLFNVFRKRITFFNKINDRWNAPVLNALSKMVHRKSVLGLLVVGMLNGLLPCGLVYMALVGSVATTSPWNGALFMMLFGLGTIPSLLILSIVGNMVSINFRNKIKQVMPYLSVMVGVLLILRGLNLNIPYLSPKIEKQEVNCCH